MTVYEVLFAKPVKLMLPLVLLQVVGLTSVPWAIVGHAQYGAVTGSVLTQILPSVTVRVILVPFVMPVTDQTFPEVFATVPEVLVTVPELTVTPTIQVSISGLQVAEVVTAMVGKAEAEATAELVQALMQPVTLFFVRTDTVTELPAVMLVVVYW